jgi:hypothetical protein
MRRQKSFEAYNARSPGFGLADLVITYQERMDNQTKQRTQQIASWRAAPISPS